MERWGKNIAPNRKVVKRRMKMLLLPDSEILHLTRSHRKKVYWHAAKWLRRRSIAPRAAHNFTHSTIVCAESLFLWQFPQQQQFSYEFVCVALTCVRYDTNFLLIKRPFFCSFRSSTLYEMNFAGASSTHNVENAVTTTALLVV
jgi:hypothetical protein